MVPVIVPLMFPFKSVIDEPEPLYELEFCISQFIIKLVCTNSLVGEGVIVGVIVIVGVGVTDVVGVTVGVEVTVGVGVTEFVGVTVVCIVTGKQIGRAHV